MNDLEMRNQKQMIHKNFAHWHDKYKPRGIVPFYDFLMISLHDEIMEGKIDLGIWDVEIMFLQHFGE